MDSSVLFDEKGGGCPSRNDFVEVILPLPLHATFTYRVPDGLQGVIGVGFRVIVPFGRKKFYTGIVVGTPNLPPEGMEVKEVVIVLDDKPVVRYPQLKLWSWIADYYLSAVGDVYKAAVPAGLKSRVRLSWSPILIMTWRRVLSITAGRRRCTSFLTMRGL